MKTRIAFCLLLVSCLSANLLANEIAFEKTWNAALQKATAQNKYVFVDFYATWCGPCLWMKKEVFTDDKVAAYFNSNFVSIQIDAEKQELALVKTLNLKAYPTLAFFDKNGKLVYSMEGALEGIPLVDLGEKVKNFSAYRTKFTDGKATLKEKTDYLSVLATSNPEESKRQVSAILNLLNDDELTGEQGWYFISELITDAGSEDFRVVMRQLKKLNSLYGRQFTDYLGGAMYNFWNKALEQNSLPMVEKFARLNFETNELLGKAKPNEYYLLSAQANYYLTGSNAEKYLPLVEKMLNTYSKDDEQDLTQWVSNILSEFPAGKNPILKQTLAWAQHAYDLDKKPLTTWQLAHVLASTGEKAKALALAKEMLKFELDEDGKKQVEEFMATLK